MRPLLTEVKHVSLVGIKDRTPPEWAGVALDLASRLPSRGRQGTVEDWSALALQLGPRAKLGPFFARSGTARDR
jgi:hypothetical protein